MEIRYKSDANHNYMIIKRDRNIKINHEKMVIRNNIEGLLKMNLHYIDEEAYYYYEIQSRQSLSRLYEGRYLTYEEMSSFLYGMSRVFKELEAYLLPTENIILDPDAVYVDIDTCSPEFAFYPAGKTENTQEAFLTLSEFLTEHADREDRRCSELAYDYYMSVCDGIFSPEGILKTKSAPVRTYEKHKNSDIPVTSGEKEEAMEKSEFDYWETEEDMSELDYFMKSDDEKENSGGSLKIAVISLILIVAAAVIYLLLVLNPSIFPFPELNETEYIFSGCIIALLFGAALTAMIFIYNRHRVKKNETMEAEKKKKLEKREDDPINRNELKEYAGFDLNSETDSDDDKTTLLNCSRSFGEAALSGREFGKNLYFKIDKDPFILGKKKDKADGIIEDKAISRLHASIKEKNGRYFLSDLNSTNGTFLNGRRLEPNETVGLEDGDTVSFAGTYMKFSMC